MSESNIDSDGRFCEIASTAPPKLRPRRRHEEERKRAFRFCEIASTAPPKLRPRRRHEEERKRASSVLPEALEAIRRQRRIAHGFCYK
jgi:hypothetical protein